jgi:hypothetical protein
MRVNVLPRDIGNESLISKSFAIENEALLLALLFVAESLTTQKKPEF